ncbi:MAG: GFA family protein [Rhodovibrionaceae bacterium]|nr:GFA family protein [Rhodovibrionaceae bacterium]
MSELYEGGCNCGGVRFTCEGPPDVVGYCHCRICRRATGAPVFVGVVFQTGKVKIEGEVSRYRSSHRGVRQFCPTCGSQLFFEPLDKPEWLEVMLGALDAPERVKPEQHIWTSRQLPWLKIDDELPRYEMHDPPLDTPTGEALPPPED